MNMSDLYVIAAIMKGNHQYKLHKKHTSLEQCKSVRDILSLIGESDLCVHEVHADVGLMEGYANDPDGIWICRSEKIDPTKPIDKIAHYLAHDVVLTSDDVSRPDTVLKAGSWVVVLDIIDRTEDPEDVYRHLLDFGYSRTDIDKWHATLTSEQLQTRNNAEKIQLILNISYNTLQ
jgi:hypothetical protein